ADAIARYRRMRGDEVLFLTGADEHGTKIMAAAEAAGQDPQAFVAQYAATIKDLADRMNISYPDVIRTTDTVRHLPSAQLVWKRLSAADLITKGHYTGWYSVNDEAYITATDAKSEAYANKTVIELAEDNYLFDLPAFSDRLTTVLSPDSQA